MYVGQSKLRMLEGASDAEAGEAPAPHAGNPHNKQAQASIKRAITFAAPEEARTTR